MATENGDGAQDQNSPGGRGNESQGLRDVPKIELAELYSGLKDQSAGRVGGGLYGSCWR